MIESTYHIPGSDAVEAPSVDVQKNPGNLDAQVDIALLAVREALGNRYEPTQETLQHTRLIDMLTRLQATHRATIASDVMPVDIQPVVELRKSDVDLVA
jgi:hypothetical protein